MKISVLAVLAAASLLSLPDCSPKASSEELTGTPGKAGGPCFDNGTCDPGLRCTPGGCVSDSMGAGGVGGTTNPSAGGSSSGGGGTSNASGGAGGGSGNAPGNGGGDGSGGNIGMGGGDPGNGGTIGAGGAPPPSTGGFGQCGGTLIDPTTFPACTTCNGGRCVLSSDYPNAPVNLLDSCGAGDVCMPDSIVATQGSVLLPSCRSVSNSEGRCASMCIPIVRSLSNVLPQGGCGPDDRCAPCSNPADGSWTGICSVGCDPGPQEPAFKFASCCTDRGRCVPRADIPNAVAGTLTKLDCTGNDDPVCVPTEVVTDPTYKFPACTFTSQPGVCVPACIVNAIPNGNLLGRGDCARTDDKCALCKNPLTGQLTGACP